MEFYLLESYVGWHTMDTNSSTTDKDMYFQIKRTFDIKTKKKKMSTLTVPQNLGTRIT